MSNWGDVAFHRTAFKQISRYVAIETEKRCCLLRPWQRPHEWLFRRRAVGLDNIKRYRRAWLSVSFRFCMSYSPLHVQCARLTSAKRQTTELETEFDNYKNESQQQVRLAIGSSVGHTVIHTNRWSVWCIWMFSALRCSRSLLLSNSKISSCRLT